MTTFSFSTGNPANLTGGTAASMNDISGPFTDLRTFLNGANLDSTNIALLGVGTAQLAALAVTAAKIEAQQAWQTLALAAPYAGSSLIYMKDSLGFVHCRGDATVNAGSTTTAAVCTLPVGYRPVNTQNFVVSNGCTISAAGVVTVTSSAGFPAYFSAITFRAEN